MAIKDDYIKIRVSKEQKALFKDIAKKKKISMSEFIIVSTEERALREKEKFEGTKSLELRVSELEQKLQEIKLKMERSKADKKKFFKNFF
ncbi:CopG family transcriptional regulator [Clostridium saudiense]|uniref:CopG family transcriptional regulator n=1 Tax=Clostridium saudiense TaxID=1414720 RepID=UPI00324273F1